MAKVSGALTRVAGRGAREEFLQTITNVDKTLTPLLSNMGTGEVNNSIFQWQTDTYRTPDTNNAREMGFVHSPTTIASTVQLSNTTQIATRDAVVSGGWEKTAKYGRSSEIGYQKAKSAIELKIDMDVILSGAQARNDGDDAGTAPRTRAIEHWIQTNVNSGVGYAYVNPTTALTDGTQRTFTQAILDAGIQTNYTNANVIAPVLLLPPTAKRIFSTFTNRATVVVDGGSVNEIVASADVYRSDFGNVTAVPSTRMRTRTVLGVQPKMADLVTMPGRSFADMELGRTGDATTFLILTEFGLRVKNEKAFMKISDLV